MIRGAVYAWAIVFLAFTASEGILMPFIMIALAIGIIFLQKWINFSWEEHSRNKRCDILEQREKRGRRFKHTWKTRLKDLWQDMLYDIKQPWE